MKMILIAILALLNFPTWANQTGLGISIGNPIGFNGKYWLDDSRAIDGGLGFSFGKHTNFSLHSDYLLHSPGAFFFNDVHPLDLYYGVGGRMEFADDIEVGIRIPIGLAHKVENSSADIFGEVAPVIDFVSKTGIELHWLFGARYYFK